MAAADCRDTDTAVIKNSKKQPVKATGISMEMPAVPADY
jgi:hypothetical protein